MTKEMENKIALNSPDGGFLQSLIWADFQKNAGANYFHQDSQNGWANIFAQKLSWIGAYGYIPRGPILWGDNKKEFLDQIVEKSQKNNFHWLRLEPRDEEEVKEYKKLGFNLKKAPHDTQPREILRLDLSQTEETLLAQMKSKTRYNIRLAKKRGVEVRTTRKEEEIEKFLDLIAVTAKRDKIISHPRSYYQKMLSSIPEPTMKLYVATFENQIIAGALIAQYGKTATYLHGASADEFRETMAPYLVQWTAMQEAKAQGTLTYDLGGVAVQEKKNRWAGITRFKRGFAPSASPLVFPGSFDLVINPKRYLLYRLLQPLSSLKRFL